MRQYLRYSGESVYIAGPACFYYDGYTLWHSLRGQAEYFGFQVTMPTTNVLDLTHEDLRKNADAIFENCAKAMNDSTALIADLESFRGTEPDGGTLFEVGMAYARGLPICAYTRDKRPMIHKVRTAALQNGQVVDENGRPLPYGELPFCPCLMGAAKIFEGGFEDALQLLMIDIDQKKLAQAWETPKNPQEFSPKTDGKTVFLFSPRVYQKDGASWFEAQRKHLAQAGLTMLSPLNAIDGEPEHDAKDPLMHALHLFERWQRQVRACDLLLVDLNDMNGLEPSGDSSFLAGMAWQLKKKCLGYMRDTRKMRERIPHYDAAGDFKDQFGNDVENFDYPINLMFASSMPIVQGEPEEMTQQVAQILHP